MGYIIGPDGKIIDDGQGLQRPTPNLTAEDMTPEMIDQMLGYKSAEPTVDIGMAQIEPAPAFAPGISADYGPQNLGQDVAPVIDPQGNVSGGKSSFKGKKVKYSESGPNGEILGNTKPYDYNPGTGQQEYANARQGLGETVGMGVDALKLKEQAGVQNADIERRQYEEQGLLAATQQAELKAGEAELASRRERRLAAGMKAQEDAKGRIEAWNKEAEAAANTEVDPNRYWNDRSNFSKISFALGALAGGLAGKTGADNDALNMLQTAIGRDINAQNDKMDRKMSFLKDKRGNIDLLNNIDRLNIADLDAEQVDWLKEFDVKLRATDKEIDKIVAKYGAERVNPKLLELKAQVLEGQASLYSQLYSTDLTAAQKKLDKEFDAEEAAKNRAATRANMKLSRSWEIEDREAAAKEAAAKEQSTGLLDTELLGGVSVTDSGATIGKVKFNPDLSPADKSKFIEQTQALAQEGLALKALEQAFSDKTWAQMVRNSKGQSAALAKAISTRYAVAGKQVSDKEIDIQIQSLIGGSGNIDSLLRSGDAKTILKNNVDENIRRGNAFYRLYTQPIEIPNADGTVTIARPKYGIEDIYRDPGAADTGADVNSLAAEIAGATGTENQARTNLADKTVDDLDYADSDQVLAAVKAAEKAGSKEDLMTMYNALNKAKMSEKEDPTLGYVSDNSIATLQANIEDALERVGGKGKIEEDMAKFFSENPGASAMDYANR